MSDLRGEARHGLLARSHRSLILAGRQISRAFRCKPFFFPQLSTTRSSRSSKLASGSASVPKTEALGGRAEHLASSIVVCAANVQQVDVCAPAALALEPAFSGVTSKGISRTFEWPGELATKFLPELTGLGLHFALSMVKLYHLPFLHFIFGKTIAGTEETSDGLLWWLPSRSRT